MAEVLLSYSHDSPDHAARVLNLADKLCEQGVDAHLDQYEHPPPSNWPRWMMDQVEAAKTVLVVCTETYNRRFRGREKSGKGKGVTWEGVIISQELYESQCKTTKFVPVIFRPEDERYIPIILRGGTHYLVSNEEGYEGLYRVLTEQPAIPKPGLGKRVELPPSRTVGRSTTSPAGAIEHPNNVPFPPNPHFTGRDNMLEELHRRLAERTTAAITQPQAVHGLGGVGKTQLADEYAWKYQADYDAVLWVVADSPENAAANLAALSRPDMLNLPEAEAKEQAVQVDAVRRWLREHHRWLLVFDSVDSREAAAAVRNLLAPVLPGHIIITSRRTDWPVTISALPVDSLPIEEATDFLCNRTRITGFEPGPRADAFAIARELDGLPLALEQAAAYILRHRVTFAVYLERLKQNRAQLLKEEAEGATRYPKSVAETWLVSEQQLNLEARAILRLAAFLAPDDIPRALFTSGSKALIEALPELAAEWGEKLPDQSMPPDTETALVELADHSLITLTPKAFSCHRLMQAVQSDRLTDKLRGHWIELALRLVNDYVPSGVSDVRTWPVMESVRAHAEMIVGHADRLGIPKPTARLLNQLGLFLNEKALYREAEPLMRRALTIDERSYGPGHPDVAIDLNNLAQLLQDTNRLAEAEPLMRRALAIGEQSYGPEHPKVAIRLNNLAALLQDTNRLAEAEPLKRRALAIDEQSYGPEHPKVAIDLNNLAQLLQATNRSTEAEPLMRRVLTIDEQSYGPGHPDVAIDLNNLAQLLQATNRLAEAEPLMRRRWRLTSSRTVRSIPTLPSASTTWRCCCRIRIGWRRPSR